MSRKPQPVSPVPEETARVARAAFATGYPSLPLRDVRGTLYQAEDFTVHCHVVSWSKHEKFFSQLSSNRRS